MIDLYALTSPNVQKVFIALEELGLPYNPIYVDVWKGENFDPAFLKVNPNGKVPVVVDHEGPGGRPYTVIESGAILIYLAEKTSRFLPRAGRERYDILQWLFLQVASVGPNFGQVTHFNRFAPAGNEYSQSRFRTEATRLFELLDQRLGETRAYLGGEIYSIADMATFPWARGHAVMGLKVDHHKNLLRWLDDVSARPAVKKALEIVATIKTARDNAEPQVLDRLFGRGPFARA